MFFDLDTTLAAKRICCACPVRETCLVYALSHEDYGVWGGLTAEERLVLRGHPLVTPEESREADAIRYRVDRGDLMPEIAESLGVSTRTLHRWTRKDRRSAVA